MAEKLLTSQHPTTAVALMVDIDELRNGWVRVELISDSCLAKEAVYFGLRVLRDQGRLETFALLEGTDIMAQACLR